MNTYRISLVDRRANSRRTLDVQAFTCMDAMNAAKTWLGPGYSFVESAYLVAAA